MPNNRSHSQPVPNSAVAEVPRFVEIPPAEAGDGHMRILELPPGRQALTVAEIKQAGKQDWVLNNAALKSIRDSHEMPIGSPWAEGIDLWPYDEYNIHTLVKGEEEAYELVDPELPWSWKKMLNAMEDRTLRHIVGVGVVGIVCMPLLDSVDGRRLHAWRKQKVTVPRGAPVPIWDFVVSRGDGSRITFHPNLTKETVSYKHLTLPTNPYV